MHTLACVGYIATLEEDILRKGEVEKHNQILPPPPQTQVMKSKSGVIVDWPRDYTDFNF